MHNFILKNYYNSQPKRGGGGLGANTPLASTDQYNNFWNAIDIKE